MSQMSRMSQILSIQQPTQGPELTAQKLMQPFIQLMKAGRDVLSSILRMWIGYSLYRFDVINSYFVYFRMFLCVKNINMR